MKESFHSIDSRKAVWNIITHKKNSEVWVESVSYDVMSLIKVKARMNVQVIQLGKIIDP